MISYYILLICMRYGEEDNKAAGVGAVGVSESEGEN